MKTKKVQTGLALVEIKGKSAFTNSLGVADGCKQNHKTVIGLVRKYKNEFEELGQVAFEKRLNTQGSPTEYALLNEDQATFLITIFRNNDIVLKFKLRLVKEFRRALNEIQRLYNDPARKAIIQEKRDEHAPMQAMLKFTRELMGKGMAKYHYENENFFCNRALTGKYDALDESTLDNYDITLLGAIRRHNTMLIAHFLKQADRKGMMDKFVADYRAKNPRTEMVQL
jgi:phage regulator Rha-like protein